MFIAISELTLSGLTGSFECKRANYSYRRNLCLEPTQIIIDKNNNENFQYFKGFAICKAILSTF